MTDRLLPTPEILCKLLQYDPETGDFVWLERGPAFFTDGQKSAQGLANIWNAKYAGKPALCTSVFGYKLGRVTDIRICAHRAAWAMMTGAWPIGEIDHINGKRDDNRWSNLREVSSAENSRNCGRSTGNTSGYTGVSFHKASGRWRAFIRFNYRQISLGYYDAPEEAHLARLTKQRELGFDARHGTAA